MKKSHLLLGLGISISLLTACQKQETTASSTSEANTTTVEETTVAPNQSLTIPYIMLFFKTIRKL